MIAKDVGEIQHAKDKREHTEYDGTYVNRAGPHWLGPSCSAVFGSLSVLLHIFHQQDCGRFRIFNKVELQPFTSATGGY
jgi:hypothetical protein